MNEKKEETFLDSLITDKIGDKNSQERRDFEKNSDAFIEKIKAEEKHEKEFQEWEKLSEEEKDESFYKSTLSYYELKEYEASKK
jgi:hypothetical protein